MDVSQHLNMVQQPFEIVGKTSQDYNAIATKRGTIGSSMHKEILRECLMLRNKRSTARMERNG